MPKICVSVVTRKQKVSIWVEGAYGTGKSHAVLTLKKLLDASPEATKEYFDKYKDQLSGDLYNQFSQIKTGDKILTVHRYGSSNIKNDNRGITMFSQITTDSRVDVLPMLKYTEVRPLKNLQSP